MNKTNLFSRTRLSIKEQAFFIKRLSFLLRAGVPILESLQILRRQTKTKVKKNILDKIISDVSSGHFLATSLKSFKNVFSDFVVNIIKVGESIGILEQNLNYLADELKKKQLLRRKIVGALMYPLFITVATLGLTAVLTMYIFPKILPIFQSLGVALPWSTRFLIGVSFFLRTYGIFVVLALVSGLFGFWFFFTRNKKFHKHVDYFLIKLPLIGRVIVEYTMANMCRTLGLLLRSGVGIIEAMTITAETNSNLVYREELYALSKILTKGERISGYLEQRTVFFPEIVAEMAAVGEASGSLSDTFLYLSELYEHEVDDFTKNISGSIEPLLMVCMGIIVGFVAVSVIAPIYEITEKLHP